MRPEVITSIPQYVKAFVEFLQSDASPERELPVVVGYQTGYKVGPHILYNTEQLSRECCRNEMVRIPDSVCEIWDYSLYNIECLRKLLTRPIPLRHVPLQTSGPWLETLKSYIVPEPEYDVALLGSYSTRRNNVLAELAKRGVRVLFIHGKYGEEHLRRIGGSRFLLNIHYADDYRIFEQERCEPWIAAGLPVISESGIDDDARCVALAPYNELVDVVCRLVSVEP